MTPTSHRLELDQDCDFRHFFEFLNPDETPVDCTDCSLAAQIRTEIGGDLLATFAPAWEDEALGQFTLLLEREAVDTIPLGKHLWDVILTDTNGDNFKIAAGEVIKRGSITRTE